nr:ATP synthase CF0, subunit B [Ishige okamurae]
MFMINHMYYIILANENFSVTINTDIFETNVINIILLLIVLFLVLSNFLKESLGSRKKKITTDVENAEERLVESKKRYKEAEKQWSQIQIVIEDIYQQAEQTKQNILKVKCNIAKQDLSKKFGAATTILRYREQKTFDDVIKEVSERALKKVVIKLQKELGEKEQIDLVNSKIKLLEDNY